MELSLKKVSLTALTATAVALVAAVPSPASSSIAVAGGAVPTSTTFTSVRSADGNTLVEGFGTHAWTGDLAGTSTVNIHFVIHSDGQLTYQGFGTFTGTTPCGTGTFDVVASGSGPFPGPASGKIVTVNDAKESVAIHMQLNTVLFLTPAGAVFTYSGDVRCG
jgi:hypothetical protein